MKRSIDWQIGLQLADDIIETGTVEGGVEFGDASGWQVATIAALRGGTGTGKQPVPAVKGIWQTSIKLSAALNAD